MPFKTPWANTAGSTSKFWTGVQKAGKAIAKTTKNTVNSITKVVDNVKKFDNQHSNVLSTAAKTALSVFAGPEVAYTVNMAAKAGDKYLHKAQDVLQSSNPVKTAVSAFSDEITSGLAATEKSKLGQVLVPAARTLTGLET